MVNLSSHYLSSEWESEAWNKIKVTDDERKNVSQLSQVCYAEFVKTGLPEVFSFLASAKYIHYRDIISSILEDNIMTDKKSSILEQYRKPLENKRTKKEKIKLAILIIFYFFLLGVMCYKVHESTQERYNTDLFEGVPDVSEE